MGLTASGLRVAIEHAGEHNYLAVVSAQSLPGSSASR